MIGDYPSVKFKRTQNNHFQTEAFEIFKLETSTLQSLNCWLKLCIDQLDSSCRLNNCNRSLLLKKVQQSKNIFFKNVGIRVMVTEKKHLSPEKKMTSKMREYFLKI